ncbi:acyl-CoA thioester hydrolase [Oceanospirillum multiglobuliferum]|uniref:Tol-pal system-associated acyl-CoA thioesterase n=1 Tax=Oceanospirillum multiglobuliferum TaxID=64969 RepID=A0A1T4RQN5_9GAMM|nr:tol-pal system-associated acyl-CoA thioesterase [Oceanospirillum multiglobuliferum]OPX54677.1 tol-pal system-associated acyl-CoA thioesterase [Oceanospirillum multiglobuliferum]SKA18068.1 acyl-CoA thioester hydrolase [Oceanospirillum multiglobuliferum]
MNQRYPFQWPVRVYYEDTDAGGVVFYANYLKFYERARTEALRSLGFQQEQLRTEAKLLFVVSSINVSYKRPAKLDDELTVLVRIEKIARTYLVFQQQIFCDDKLLSEAEVKVAAVSEQQMKPLAIPVEMRSALEQLAENSSV